MTPIYKNDHREDLGNYKPVSLTSVTGKNLPCLEACAGQLGDQVQLAWVHERQILLNQSDLLIRLDDSPGR